ncbi:MAG: hypothetical protein Fur0037_26250 [Planctomycetota bacterium]
MAETIEVRAYREGDEYGIVAGYNEVFPTPDGKIPRRDIDHWRWLFRDNPVGSIQITVADHETEGIVGAYPVVPLRMTIDGERRIGAQVVDLYVVPRHRRYGKRPGLFVSLGLEHYRLWTGIGKTEIHFGWAVPAWRIGHKYLSYENIRDWNFLFRRADVPGFGRRSEPGDLEVVEVSRYGEDVDRLWARLEPTFRCATVRDSIYLNWRYADARSFRYRLLECRNRRDGALRGIAVFSTCDFLFDHTSFLVDWLVPADDGDATLSLIAAAEKMAQEARSPVLATLFNPIDPRSLIFQDHGFRVFGTTYFICMAPFDHRGTVFYRDHWYLTCGDSDLV